MYVCADFGGQPMDTLLLFSLIQLVVVIFFAILERLIPYKKYQKDPFWWKIWLGLGTYACIWLQVLAISWASVSIPSILDFDLSSSLGCIFFYLFYSHGNYWFHRLKHSTTWFWQHVHELHHAPRHMEVALAFFRHPIEIAVNSLYLFFIGKVLFNVSFEIIFMALIIEGCLETFHHANIHWSRRLDWVGKFIQTPPMHLIHHQYGRHSDNYSPIFWDYLYGTCNLNSDREVEKIGLSGRLGSKIGDLDLTIRSLLYKVCELVTKITNNKYSIKKH